MGGTDESRREFAERLERHQRRNEIDLEVQWLEEAPLDSLAVRLFLTDNPSIRFAEELDEYVIAWHRVGVLGGFEGVVHDVSLKGLARDNGELVYEVMLDLGSAPRSALDVFLRGLRGLKVAGLPVSKVVLGWTTAEAWRAPLE